MTESSTGESQFGLINGLFLERGFVSPLFVEEAGPNADKQNVLQNIIELEKPLVLVVADKITKVSQIVPIMEMVKKSPMKRSLLLVSEDLQQDPLSTMVYNNKKEIIECCAINIPWLAGVHKEQLKDIAAMTGATLVDNEYGLKLEDVELKHFGSAKIIKIDAEHTHIVGGEFDPDALEARMDQIRRQIEEEDKHNMKGVHRERLARMQAKIAEI